ncbi:MAG: threonine synthase [Actinobacteria bacterium]|nr:threonine synthase [Actinomycetota bacterium]
MNSVLYYSTNLQTKPVTFREALLQGLASDRGLYMPKKIPPISANEIQMFSDMPYYEIAFTVLRKFLHEQIPDKTLMALAQDAYDFSIPLEQVYEGKYVMRLDHGPTASFKDFAARMMGRMMQYFLKQENRSLLILTATSGDTGSAIANAFYGLENIHVVVLFPEKEVSARQRKQMTTLGQNTQIIALDGKFDDCQAFVKRAFADPELTTLNLSSANSINVGRLLPQSVYYFYAFSRLAKNKSTIFSVPSGNFGDMMGGLLAMKMGLPVKKFIIATNENDAFPKFMQTGTYKIIVPSINCISSAMNVGHPSNMSRVFALYGGVMDEKGNVLTPPHQELMRKEIYSTSVTNDETRETIKEAFDKHRLLLEPHGAVAWTGLQRYLEENKTDDTKDQVCVTLETAHPAKFPEQIREILSVDPELPDSLAEVEKKQEAFVKMGNNYEDFREFLKRQY